MTLTDWFRKQTHCCGCVCADPYWPLTLSKCKNSIRKSFKIKMTTPTGSGPGLGSVMEVQTS